MSADTATMPDPPTAAFPELPGTGSPDRADRRVGIEVEFGGLAPEEAAHLARRILGGDLRQGSAAEWCLDGSGIGTVEVYLDTAYRPAGDDSAAKAGVALARQVVPIEIVTEPLAQGDLPRLEALIAALRQAGALGSRGNIVYGFGLHLNVTLADPGTGADLPRVARAFGLLEPWLRARDPLDLARRALPFTQPYPEAFVDALAGLPADAGPAALFDLLDAHVASRNHGLDLLPAYAHCAPARFRDHPGATASVSARPAYHYRMPESRVDEAAWSLSYEWRRWWLVERVACRPDLLDALSAAWGRARAAGERTGSLGYLQAVTRTLGPLAAMAPEGGPA